MVLEQLFLIKNGKELWFKMHDARVKLRVKNMYDLVRKEIHGILNTKDSTEEQVWNYKARFDDSLYIIGDLALNIIMHFRFSSEQTEKFTSELGFKQHDLIMTKEKSILI